MPVPKWRDSSRLTCQRREHVERNENYESQRDHGQRCEDLPAGDESRRSGQTHVGAGLRRVAGRKIRRDSIRHDHRPRYLCRHCDDEDRLPIRIAVSDVTAERAYTWAPDDDATVALQAMKSQRVRRLPVVDVEGRRKGILSLNDVVTHAGAALSTEIVSTMASICEHRRPGAITREPR